MFFTTDSTGSEIIEANVIDLVYVVTSCWEFKAIVLIGTMSAEPAI